MGDGGWDLPTDAFAEILVRIPASTRRRLRLVCRHWRGVIDERAPARPSEPKPLAYVIHRPGSIHASGSAYVFDGDPAQGRRREVWRDPAQGRRREVWRFRFHLAEVRGRLGFVVTVDEPKLAKVEVWVLGDGGGRRAWSCRYRVQVHGPPRQQLARPHFEFARGQCVLTNGSENRDNGVFAHRLGGAAGRLQCREVRINERKPGTAVADFSYGNIRTFASVETTEALSVSLSL